VPKAQLPAERQSCAKRPEGPDIPIYGEDECAICAVTGQHSAPTDSAQLFLALPLKPAALRVVLCDVDSEMAHPFQARAPPLV